MCVCYKPVFVLVEVCSALGVMGLGGRVCFLAGGDGASCLSLLNSNFLFTDTAVCRLWEKKNTHIKLQTETSGQN